MATLRIRAPSGLDATQWADWLEARMIVERQLRVSRSRVRRYLSNVVYLDDEELDVQVDLLFQEMERRRLAAGEGYPFVERDTGVELKVLQAALPYTFLLCVSTSEELRSESRQSEVEALLDSVVEEALRRYLGGTSRGVRFGWPPSGGRPAGFIDAIAWLARTLGLPVGTAKRRRMSKDGGVDVVAWRPFRDRREGFVAILAQCTVALDWVPKAKDIMHDVWRGWIDFGKDPITCLAIPYVVPGSFDRWDELRRTVHFVLDRLRICELLEGATLLHAAELSQFVSRELARMGAQV